MPPFISAIAARYPKGLELDHLVRGASGVTVDVVAKDSPGNPPNITCEPVTYGHSGSRAAFCGSSDFETAITAMGEALTVRLTSTIPPCGTAAQE